jgi:site-specific DNA-methyltransferase (adenine-specific)
VVEKTRESLNPHPTVKPIALTKYLATLLLPPEMYAPRRIFVPFAGVASEMIGAWQGGWEEIVGVELKEEYAEVGRLRIDYWVNKHGHQLSMF